MSRFDRLLSWFPAGWQARYADEVRVLLHSQPMTWRISLDLLVACGDAWVREGMARAHGLRPTVVPLTLVAATVTAIGSFGWVLAAGAHGVTTQLGFAGWLQGHAGPSLSAWLLWSRDPLWLAACWIFVARASERLVSRSAESTQPQ